MTSSNVKKVLVAPLDWGLGHATRCIPIIRELLSSQCEVQIASSGDALKLLKEEFPQLKFYKLPSYSPEYSASNTLIPKILLQLPKFWKAIRDEHVQIEEIVANDEIDLIVSDNRYGCWCRNVRSVFVTHQLWIRLPSPWHFFSSIVSRVINNLIRKFDECWVPDFANGITHSLTNSKCIRPRYIGMLSRFEKLKREIKYDVVVVISGPEPQRGLLERKLLDQLPKSGLKYLMVKGKLSQDEFLARHEFSFSTSHQLNEWIESAAIVVGRSGYSSVMDLWKLGKKAIFIPTPGQPEQEHLAHELQERRIAFCVPQDQFDLQEALRQSKLYSGFDSFSESANLLREAIKDVLK